MRIIKVDINIANVLMNPVQNPVPTHLSAGPPGLMVVMVTGRDLFLSSWAPPTPRKKQLVLKH